MKTCPRCQDAYPDDMVFCPRDGVRLGESDQMAKLIPTPGTDEPDRRPPPASIFAKTRPPESSVRQAVSEGNLKQINALLKDTPALVLSKDTSGQTLLHWAAEKGQKNVAELLLANGADVNAEDSGITIDPDNGLNGGYTPLHLAAKNGHKDVAELLLAHAAEVNARNKKSETPLH